MGGSVGKSSSDNDTSSQSTSDSGAKMNSSSGGASNAGNESQFRQNIWGPQGDSLSGLYSALEGLFNTTNQGMQGQTPGAVNNMQGIFNSANPVWQNQMEGGSYQGMPLQENYQDALKGGGNEQFINESVMGGAGNNYVDAMKNQMQQDSDQRLGRSLAMNDARAAGYQQSGSSRHGLTESRLYDDANDRLATQQTGLGYNTFDKDLDRKLDIARNADKFDMFKIQNTGDMLGNDNAARRGGLDFSKQMPGLNMSQFAPGMAPWAPAGKYSSGVGPPTVLGEGSGSAFSNADNTSDTSSTMRSSSTGTSYGDASSKGFGTGGGLFGK